MTHFIYSLITLFIAIFFVLLGLIGIIISLSSNMKALAASLILDHSILMFIFGLCILCIGAATVFNIVISSRRKYHNFKVGNQPVSVDTQLIESYVKNYLQDLFPNTETPSRVELKKSKLHITLDLPYIPLESQHDLTERMKSELQELLTTLLGYKQPFNLSVSFQLPPK